MFQEQKPAMLNKDQQIIALLLHRCLLSTLFEVMHLDSVKYALLQKNLNPQVNLFQLKREKEAEMYPQCITAPWDAPVFLFETENID